MMMALAVLALLPQPAAAGQADAAPPASTQTAALGPVVVAVAADARRPRDEGDLRAGCRHRDRQGLVTFVQGGDGRVLLATLTARALADPRRDIWLAPQYTREGFKGRATATQDWAYVLDQDGDGRIDWIAFLIGPLPIRTGAPDEPPVPRIVDGSVQVTGIDAMRAFVARIGYGFWQAADSDGDGVADLVAWPAERSEDGWYRGWAIERLGSEPACTLVDAKGRAETACASAGDRDVKGKGAKAHRWAADAAGVFARIRSAGIACRLAATDLRRLMP
jgi:hypothetical protein